jgi:hypothetical protein
LLTDAAAGEITSKTRIERQVAIKTSSFPFLRKLINLCTEVAPFKPDLT